MSPVTKVQVLYSSAVHAHPHPMHDPFTYEYKSELVNVTNTVMSAWPSSLRVRMSKLTAGTWVHVIKASKYSFRPT